MIRSSERRYKANPWEIYDHAGSSAQRVTGANHVSTRGAWPMSRSFLKRPLGQRERSFHCRGLGHAGDIDADPHCWIHLIAGDIFYCLRSALDQAVYYLAKDSFPYPDWTQFPIFDEDTAETRKRFARYTRGVDSEAVSFIKSLQPYVGLNREPLTAHMLWMLNKMCNIDKHRRIPIRGCATDISFKLP